MELQKLERKTVTQRVACYLRENHIPVEQIENDLGIPADKLMHDSGRELDAAEFLELCVYLNIRPECFREKHCIF